MHPLTYLDILIAAYKNGTPVAMVELQFLRLLFICHANMKPTEAK